MLMAKRGVEIRSHGEVWEIARELTRETNPFIEVFVK